MDEERKEKKVDVKRSRRGDIQRRRYETREKKIGRGVKAVGLAAVTMSNGGVGIGEANSR